MKQRDVLLAGLAVIIIGAGILSYTEKPAIESSTGQAAHDGTFIIDGQPVTLVEGESVEEAAPGSASKIVTKYFGNDVEVDLNGDGINDRAFFITRNTGGSGTFFYVVGLVEGEAGDKGTDAVFIGDRIAPQSLNVKNGNILVVNYADRKEGESFDVMPSVGKTLQLKLDPQTLQFGQVASDFEGEANPSTMTLDMKKWTWVETLYEDGRRITPKQNKFTLLFKENKVTIGTDCNQSGGTFTATKDTISITDIFATKMFCEGSQEGEFWQMLEHSTGYHFTSKGELILHLKFDSGSVVFR